MIRPDPARAAVDLTIDLVAIDSVNPGLVAGAHGEVRIAAVLAERLQRAGYTVDLLPAASDPRRVSLVATRTGTRPGRTVVLNGHLDTVGVEGMADPFTARVDGGRLTGRGASDMKGGVAGLVVAAERLAADDAPGTVIVALVADEEDASIGAETVLDHLAPAVAMDVCLIAEPTWLDLAVAHRGYAVVEVALRGRSAHSSQPDAGVDAVRAMGELLSAVARADDVLRQRQPHPLLSLGSLMATVARGGTAPFTIAASADVVIERRTLPGETADAALDDVRALLDPIAAAFPGLETRATLGLARDAWQADAVGAAAEFSAVLATELASAGSPSPERVGAPYWMESALWQAAGVPTVVCGPAGGGLHAIDEWVDVAQLESFPVAVAAAVRRFLAGES